MIGAGGFRLILALVLDFFFVKWKQRSRKDGKMGGTRHKVSYRKIYLPTD